MLCSVCRGLPPLAEFNGVEPHHTISSLQISAQKGCEFCVLILQALAPTSSLKDILAGKTEEKPEEAQVSLHYGPFGKLQLDRQGAQYIWVSPSVYTEGGAKLELFVNRGKQYTISLVAGFSVRIPQY